MSKMQLLLLGHFGCLLPSDKPLTLSMRKAEVLLAYLALAPGIRHPRERLINLLWSNRGDEQARNSLRQCLSAIRKTLGDAADLALQIDRTTVSLKADLIDVDALEFERLASAGEPTSLADAAALYRGEFLEGIAIRDAACQEWLDSERTRFKRQYIEILSSFAHSQLAARDFNAAMRSAERLVEQDPLGESAWRLLMRACHENGDRSHALQAFKRCQQVMRDELDVEPEGETIALRDAIASGKAKTDTPAQATPAATGPVTPATLTADDHSIAVLPFDNLSGDPEQEYFSDGITTSLILSLGMFRGLTVKSQNSSFAYKNSGKSSEEIAEALQVTYLVEGRIRKSAEMVRISVQLIESVSGNQVWGKQYDARLEDILELEQELSRSIAGTISGRIGHALQQSAVRKPAKNLQSFDYLMRGLYHFGKMTAGDLAFAKQEIAKCLEIDPDNSTAHTNLGEIHHVEVIEGWSMDTARSNQLASNHLEKAVEVDPDNALAHAYLSEFLTIHRDYRRGEFHANRAIELNPTASEGYMVKADLLGCCRRIDEAIDCADQCLHLDPHSVGAGWAAGSVYRKAGQYEKAINTYRSISHPPTSIHALIAISFIGLGLTEEARNEMCRYRELARKHMTVYPQSEDAWRSHWRSYEALQFEEDFDEMFAQLIEAGLCDELGSEGQEVPSIAVLPFENMSGDPEQAFFSDGITADIIATLSKFRHLRIVARHSTEIYRERKASIAEIAAEQGVRYILEGSVRKSGKRIRVSAELIDSQSGQNCWSERYDRDLDDLFAVQDELTQQIALAMKVQLDDGDMARHRSAGTRNIKAWELTMTAVDLQDTYIQQNIFEARSLAKQALALDPEYVFAHVVLAWTYWQDVYGGWSEDPEQSLIDSETSSQLALQLDPDNADALAQAGTGFVMRHNTDKAMEYSRRAVEIEPGNAENQALRAFACIFAGDYEQARVHHQHMRRLCPVLPNWYYLILGQIEQYDGDLDQAICVYKQGIAVEPDSTLCRFYLVHALMQKGDISAAQKLADEIQALDSSANGGGLVRAVSMDAAIRDQFHQHLAQFELVQD